jgi:hypothetical protein
MRRETPTKMLSVRLTTASEKADFGHAWPHFFRNRSRQSRLLSYDVPLGECDDARSPIET